MRDEAAQHAGGNKRQAGEALLRLGRNFSLGGVSLPSFPCPLNSKGGLILPAVDYLTERAVYGRINISTIAQEAYILKDWFAFCESRQRSWKEPNDEFLKSWRTHLEHRRVGRRKEDREAWSRNNRMLSVVLRFYHVMQTDLHAFDLDVIGDPGRDGGAERPLTATLSQDGKQGQAANRKGIVLHRVRYGNKPEILHNRPTPRPHQVKQILDKALDRPTDFASSTHYLMARCAAQAGLRAIGVSSLTIDALSDALMSERQSARRIQPGPPDLDLHLASTDKELRASVLQDFAALERMHRKHVFVAVTEKRSVTRWVAMPLSLAKELVEYVWDDRFRFLERRSPSSREQFSAREVFLSSKTARGFTKGAVSNLLKAAFRAAGVSGSGHRLRAAYAEEVVRDAYLRARAVHGRNYDPVSIELLVREALGHKLFKTVAPYLNHIRSEENLLPGQPVLVERQEYAAAVRALVDAINEGQVGAVELVHDALQKLGRQPRPEPATIADIKVATEKRRSALAVS